jgi:hypothetical protein
MKLACVLNPQPAATSRAAYVILFSLLVLKQASRSKDGVGEQE